MPEKPESVEITVHMSFRYDGKYYSLTSTAHEPLSEQCFDKIVKEVKTACKRSIRELLRE